MKANPAVLARTARVVHRERCPRVHGPGGRCSGPDAADLAEAARRLITPPPSRPSVSGRTRR